MPDYSKGKIYKVFIEDEPNKVYIGSTTLHLEVRLYYHTSIKNTTSNKILNDTKNAKIELLEEYPCSCKKELETREKHWMDQYPNRVNKNIPARTEAEKRELAKQYREENREKITEIKKEYYEANKEKILERVNIYYKNDGNKEHQREYQLQNKDKINERRREYHLQNKDKINERRRSTRNL
jgi:hypothetical protein